MEMALEELDLIQHTTLRGGWKIDGSDGKGELGPK